MGNASSNGNEEEYHDGCKDEESSDCENDEEKATAMHDFQSLFDHAGLCKAVERMKDDVPENPILKHQPYLVNWLVERIARNETVLTQAKFCDVLTSLDVSREDALQAFRQFDREQDGEIDMATLLEELRSAKADKYTDLGYIVRNLQACSLTPGFIDVYSEHKDSLKHHGLRLLNFLQRNRAPVEALPFHYLSQFNQIMDMRLTALKHHFKGLKESAELQEEDDVSKDGEEIKIITHCFKSIELSSNQADAYKMTDGLSRTYWTSRGPEKSHWIRLRMRDNVVIKQLSVSVGTSEQSYLPQCFIVSVGKTSLSLKEIKETKVETAGDFVVLENCTQFYPVIQISVKSTTSDGCDVRIHGIKTVGYSILEENDGSMMDTTISWYLQMMSSTAIATMPLAPHLQQMLLNHSLNALKRMGPLSLCPNSSYKPAFLSTHVLNETSSVLSRIAVDREGKVLAEGLHSQLAFNLARGHVAGVLNTLLCLQKNDELELNAASLLKDLDSAKEMFWKKQGGPLQLSIVGCDGGEEPSVENILSWTNEQAYLSAEGKLKVNVFFKAQDYIQLTKLRIKVGKGAKGPRRGLVFVYQDKESFDLEKHVKRFQMYDDWTVADYNTSRMKVKTAGLGRMPDNPVAHFTTECDWDEVEVTLDGCPVGQYILVKFLEPRQADANGLSIVGVKFYGFPRKAVFCNNSLALQVNEEDPSIDTTKQIPTDAIHLKILDFLVAIARDLTPPKKSGSRHKRQALDMAEMGIGLIWDVYQGYKDRKCQNLTLQLLHVMFPFLAKIKDNSQKQREAFFQHLCGLVDGPGTDMEESDLVVVKEVIIDGAAVFFPDKEERRKQLFSTMIDMNTILERQSVALIFSSLCKFFSVINPGDLLDLPDKPDETFDVRPVLEVMETLISVAYRDFSSVLDKPELADQASHLGYLLCSLQTSLFVWVHQHTDGQSCTIAEEVLVKYFSLTSEKVTKALDKLARYCQKWSMEARQNRSSEREEAKATSSENTEQNNSELGAAAAGEDKPPLKQVSFKTEDEQETNEKQQSESDLNKDTTDTDSILESKINDMLQKLEKAFLATSVRQMLLVINMMCDQLSSSTRVEILKSMMPILVKMKALVSKTSNICLTIDSSEWDQKQCQEVVLRSWEVESPHDYKSEQHTTQVFSCPGATKFTVVFDPECRTEERYDYLEFTDSQGVKTRYDDKVGSDRWPLTVTFKGGHRLDFLFHSDDSNNYWGYKFKVTAVGYLSMTLNWLFDLELCLYKVCGIYSGAILDSELVLPKLQLTEEMEEGEEEMQKSELWTTLFRGGYMAGKLQRSLSGKFMTDEDEVTTAFLLDMIDGSDKEGLEAEFLQKCRSQCGATELGGPEVSETITAVFAALLWHTQHVREEITNYIQRKGDGGIKDGVLQTYRAAESLRTLLVEKRQKWNLARTENPGSVEENPVNQCKEKALFLLKFAGLTKLPLWNSSRGKLARRVSTVNRLPGGPQGRTIKMERIFEKFPSFQLVLEFVSDPRWSLTRVEEMIKRGSNQAKAVSQVYRFASDFLELMSEGHIFQISTVLYLQEVLRHQSNFPRHYADDLEGCGLDLESRVRGSYYKFVRRLVDSLRGTPRSNLKKAVVYAYDFIQACTLHFLDIHWQPFDLLFLDELEIPEFFVSLAKRSVSKADKVGGETDEDVEFVVYMQEMEWQQQYKNNFDVSKFLVKIKNCAEPVKKMMRMFGTKNVHSLPGYWITCDGCSDNITNDMRYRCLICEDVDLCAKCYSSDAVMEAAGGKHTSDHEIVELRYKCSECQAYISGTRFHCDTCGDVNLCLGCNSMGHCPGGHSADHKVMKIPPVKLKLNKELDSPLQSYIHEHVWLLFSSLALSMANRIYSSGHQMTDADVDYTKVAMKLHNSCMSLSFHCLRLVSAQDDTDGGLMEDKESFQQRAFAVHSQERIMGLLGALVPPESKADISEDVICTFKSVDFFKLLFTIAMSEHGPTANTRCMAMDLMSRLLTKGIISCTVCDEASAMAEKAPIPEGSVPGLHTAKSLFSFGATCLEKSGLVWANSMASILQQLLGCSAWKDVILQQLINSIDYVTENPMAFQPALPNSTKETSMVNKCDLINLLVNQKGLTDDKAQEIGELVSSGGERVNLLEFVQALRLCSEVKNASPLPQVLSKQEQHLTSALSSVFSLFIVAGFPEVLSVGSQVRYTNVAGEAQNGVVLQYFPDQNQSSIIDKKNRKKYMVNDEQVECEGHESQIVDPKLIQAFVKVTQDIAAKVKQGKFSEERVSIEHTWLLYLALKALLHVLQQETKVSIPDLFTPPFIQCIVHLASQPTFLSKQWLLKDLEILSLKLYAGCRNQDETTEDEKSKEETKQDEGKNEPEDESTEEMKEDKPEETEDLKSQHCLEDLSHQDRFWFYTLSDDLEIPLPMLRAMYEMHGKTISALLVSIQENMVGEIFQPSAKLEEEAKKWELADNQSVFGALEGISDASQNQIQESKYLDKAEPEQTEENENLIPTEHDRVISMHRKTFSAGLLKKAARESHGRLYLRKVNISIAVLYARQLLTKLLANWPGDGQVITAQLIGCRDSTQVPYILDLLNSSDNDKLFKKVVENVVTQIKEKMAFALTACHFMYDVNLITITKESEHDYKENTDFQDKVHIPGADFLIVQFDSRCITEENCDVLTISSNENFPSENRRVFSGSRELWQNVIVPGDTLYYKFVSDSSNNFWGYKFTVTGDQIGRFDTGYLVLRCILSNTDIVCDLPQEELWRNLVYVANKQTGEQRLKALHLLIKLMQAQFSHNGYTKLRLDLSLLKPLWQLNNSIADWTEGSDQIMPHHARALMELFFVAENLALDWGVEKQYVMSLVDNLQDTTNKAADSDVAGPENEATEGIIHFVIEPDNNTSCIDIGAN